MSDMAYVDSSGSAMYGAATSTMLGRSASVSVRAGPATTRVEAAGSGRSSGPSGAGIVSSPTGIPLSAQPWRGEEEVPVAGSYGSKVEAVVRRVVHLLSQDPTTQVGGWVDGGGV